MSRTEAEQTIRRAARWLRKRFPVAKKTIIRIVPTGKCVVEEEVVKNGKTTVEKVRCRGWHKWLEKTFVIELEHDVPHAMLDVLNHEWAHCRIYPDRNEGSRIAMEEGYITETMFYRKPNQ